MPDMSESEARALLQQRLRCVDCGSWKSQFEQPGALRIRAGLITAQGQSTNLSVDLRIHHSPRSRTFQFTVHLANSSGSHRVYQLEVKRSQKRIKDRHKLSHEHYGSSRFEGPREWDDWEYDEVLRYFCSQTNIDFQPLPREPKVTLKQRKK